MGLAVACGRGVAVGPKGSAVSTYARRRKEAGKEEDGEEFAALS